MSRFELYGGINCTKCEWYGPECEQKVPVSRCFHPDNWRTDYIWGQIFFKRPDDINWNKRCQKYKSKGEQ
jgi:hypothetical protein